MIQYVTVPLRIQDEAQPVRSGLQPYIAAYPRRDAGAAKDSGEQDFATEGDMFY